MDGWISLHRKILDNPIVCKDSDHFAIWCYLLLKATHKPHDVEFAGKRITLEKGQLITGRKSIAQKLNINESKVQRVLKKLEIEQQIEQQTSSRNRLITVLNWSSYQTSEQQNEQQVNNKRTTSEQQVNTNNNVITEQQNNGNNKKSSRFTPPSVEEVSIYCQERNNGISAEAFIAFYDSKGWYVGKNKMKDWKASVRTWETRSKKEERKVVDF